MNDLLAPLPPLSIRPYRLASVTNDQRTVEFITFFAWLKWLPFLMGAGSIAVAALLSAVVHGGMLMVLCPLLGASVGLWLLYLVVVQRGYRPVNIAIRSAMKEDTADFQGGAYSFGRPLRVTFPRTHASTFLATDENP